MWLAVCAVVRFAGRHSAAGRCATGVRHDQEDSAEGSIQRCSRLRQSRCCGPGWAACRCWMPTAYLVKKMPMSRTEAPCCRADGNDGWWRRTGSRCWTGVAMRQPSIPWYHQPGQQGQGLVAKGAGYAVQRQAGHGQRQKRSAVQPTRRGSICCTPSHSRAANRTKTHLGWQTGCASAW